MRRRPSPAGRSQSATLLALLLLAGAAPRAEARQAEDFHGLLLRCGRHPTVQISGRVAYAYETELTRYTEGRATLLEGAVTVSFPGRYGTFTITRRGGRFMSGGTVCRVDDV